MDMVDNRRNERELIAWLFENYQGYTPDFYMCVQEKKDEAGLDTAIMMCEALYG